jgi:DNA-binding NarL/FixJ family response regulator
MLIKVLIADDTSMVRRFEKILLETDAEIEIVGEAANGPEAIRLAGELKPDVIVIDLNMPGDGFTATRDVKIQRPQAMVLATTADPELYESQAEELGADALLSKSDMCRELIPTIKRLAKLAA